MSIRWTYGFEHGNYLASLAFLLSLLFALITVQFLPSSRASYICLQCFHVPNLPTYLLSLFLVVGMPGKIFCTPVFFCSWILTVATWHSFTSPVPKNIKTMKSEVKVVTWRKFTTLLLLPCKGAVDSWEASERPWMAPKKKKKKKKNLGFNLPLTCKCLHQIIS